MRILYKYVKREKFSTKFIDIVQNIIIIIIEEIFYNSLMRKIELFVGETFHDCSSKLMFSILKLVINVHSLNHSYLTGGELGLDSRL